MLIDASQVNTSRCICTPQFNNNGSRKIGTIFKPGCPVCEPPGEDDLCAFEAGKRSPRQPHPG